MPHISFQLNHLAILVVAVILWLLGALWYSPAGFGKKWMVMVGISKDAKPKGMMLGMVSSFICNVVLAFVLDHLIVWANAYTFKWGAFIGSLVWIGFFATPSLPQYIYEGRPFKLFAINYGYWFLGLIIAGGVLAIWR